MTEKILHTQVCQYLDLQYPDVIYTSDMSGMRVSIGLRVEMKRKRCKKYVIPDLLILHPKKGYHGLLIEIKADKEDLYNKNGEMKKVDHLENQCKSLVQLNSLGYLATFSCGFKECKNIIDNYLMA
jgi:transposase